MFKHIDTFVWLYEVCFLIRSPVSRKFASKMPLKEEQIPRGGAENSADAAATATTTASAPAPTPAQNVDHTGDPKIDTPMTEAQDFEPTEEPVREYLYKALNPALSEGIKNIAKERPSNPLRTLGEYLIAKCKEN